MSKKYTLVVVAVLISTGCTLQDIPSIVEISLEVHGSDLIATNEFLYASATTTRCIDWEGNIIWETETLWGSEMIFLGDSLFLRAYDRPRWIANVQLLDLQGNILWKKDIGETTTGGLGASNDLLVAGSKKEDDTGILWTFSKTGETLWTYDHYARIDEIVVAPDSSCIVFTDYYGGINCVQNGELIWSHPMRGSSMVGSVAFHPGECALAFAPDSSYIVYSYESEKETGIVACAPDGNHLWDYPFENRPLTAVITSDSQYIILGSIEQVHKLTSDGTLVWSADLLGEVYNLAVTPEGEYIAAGGDRGRNSVFVVLNGDGTVFWKTKTINLMYAVAISPDGAFAAYSMKSSYLYIFHNPPHTSNSDQNEKTIVVV